MAEREAKSEIRVQVGRKSPDKIKQVFDALDARVLLVASLAAAALGVAGKLGDNKATYYEPIKLPTSGQFLGYFDNGAEFIVPQEDLYGLDCGYADRPSQLDKKYRKSVLGSATDSYGQLYRVVCKGTDERNTLQWIKPSEMPVIPERPSDSRPPDSSNSATS